MNPDQMSNNLQQSILCLTVDCCPINLGPVVQKFVSLMSSLRPQIVK